MVSSNKWVSNRTGGGGGGLVDDKFGQQILQLTVFKKNYFDILNQLL